MREEYRLNQKRGLIFRKSIYCRDFINKVSDLF